MIHALLAGSAYAVAQALNIAIGVTFSAGAIDFFLFGILQGNSKTNWVFVPIIGFIYFSLLYYSIFKFVIKRYDFKTVGRGEDTQLHTKKDYSRKKSLDVDSFCVSLFYCRSIRCIPNILDVDTCTTRLRATLKDPTLVDEKP